MFAIYKRELRSYFVGVIGYAFLVIYLAIAGILFSYTTLFSMSSDVTSYFTMMLIFSAVALPLLTMKSFSEERKSKTEQLVLTAPVSLPAMVFGKFFASYTVFGAATIFTSFYFLFLIPYAQLQFAVLLGNLIALLLVGMVFISIGLFVSSLTENQLAAAVITVAIILVMLILDMLNNFINVYAIRFVLSWFSVLSRFSNFTTGILDFSAILYYLSIAGIFLLLTVRVYDKRRWG